MAIKGKSKARARRVTTNAPKPVTVVPKKPFLARRWVRWTALGLLLLVVGSILYLTWKNQRDEDELAAKREALTTFQNTLEAPVAAVRQNMATGVVLFSDMRAALEQFKEQTVDPSTVIQDATGWEDEAAEALEELEAIVPSREVRTKGVPISMIDAHSYMSAAVADYREAAATLKAAAQSESTELRAGLLVIAERLMDAADDLVADAYAKINNERHLLGIEQSPIA
jgi:hypothetical protein